MPDSAAARHPGEVTRLLEQAADGDREAFDRLFPLVYAELERLAHNRLRFERPGHTLETRALVDEAYVRLVGQTRTEWRNTQHFFAVASEAMRRILVDYAKRRRATKRGGAAVHLPFDEVRDVPAPDGPFSDEQAAELMALDDALGRLADFNPRGVQIAQYRYFGGLSIAEVCEVMELSQRGTGWARSGSTGSCSSGRSGCGDAMTLRPPTSCGRWESRSSIAAPPWPRTRRGRPRKRRHCSPKRSSRCGMRWRSSRRG